MTDPGRSRAQILSIAGLLGALALAVPAGADAQTMQSYTCADRTQSGATSASISLTDPPASITAGQSLTLAADLTLTLPQSFDLTAEASLVSQIGLSTTTFGLQVQIGNTVQVVPAAITVGQLKTLGLTGETASAALTFPAVSVPSTATGDVTVSMPTAAQDPNSVASTPAEVVFNAVLEQESYLGTPSSSNLACADPSTPAPAAQVVAQIPIQAAAAAATTTKRTKTTTPTKSKTTAKATKSKTTTAKATKSTQASGSTSTPSLANSSAASPAALAGQSVSAVSGAATPTASSAPQASTAGAAATSSATPTSVSGSDATATPVATDAPATVMIPPRTVGRGTFIPTWELILMGSLLPIAALGYAWYMRRTLAAARIDLQQRLGSAPLDPDGSARLEPERGATIPTPTFVTRESQTRT